MNKKGFTLIELLIVVVIIGILAAIAIPRFGDTRDRAHVSAMQSDLNQLRTAMEMYYQDNSFSYANATIADLVNETDGVTLAFEGTPDANSWAATANHDATSWGCFYDSEEGTIDCDESGPPTS